MPPAPPAPSQNLRIAVSAGDPLGIGPEVIVKALADEGLRSQARFLIYGDEAPLLRAADRAGITPFWRSPAHDGPGCSLVEVRALPDDPHAPTPSAPTAAGGAASFAYLDAAITAAGAGAADGIVTAPISKEAWHLAGIDFPGHTEVLARRFEAPRSAMLFVGPTLRVILVTIHVALRDVPRLVTRQRVFDAIDLGAQACRQLGIASPRVAVAGLNPHAGEGGLFGDEDKRQIAPAVEEARAAGIDATGPHPGDAVFLAAAQGKHDLVVAMYHDQGLIPVKLLDRDRAVNVTAGLPIVRTSPAHGTAFDIAGRNLASPASMAEALRLAVRMARGKSGKPASG